MEIEFTGVKRVEVVRALENLFQTIAIEVENKKVSQPYTYHKIIDNNGDKWLIVRDRSIEPQIYKYRLDMSCSHFEVCDLGVGETEFMVELVSPALTSKSLPVLFTIIDVVKSLGGIVNDSCGMHVHIDKPSTVGDIYKLFRRFISEQDNICSHFGVFSSRLEKYCKLYSTTDLPDEFDSVDNFLEFLYSNYADYSNDKRDNRSVRYYALNFYSLVEHGTIEFRLFNATLNKVAVAKILDWIFHFVYTSEDYNDYIPVLGGILMNEIRK